VVRRHLDRLGLLAPLAVQVFSDEVGWPKPDPRAFRAALDPFGMSPGRAVHVGDLRRTDVAGARALGMRSVRIRARHDDQSPLPEADAVVASHAELRLLLGATGRDALR
jgi:putative hydrolase of the HAD superfamily